MQKKGGCDWKKKRRSSALTSCARAEEGEGGGRMERRNILGTHCPGSRVSTGIPITPMGHIPEIHISERRPPPLPPPHLPLSAPNNPDDHGLENTTPNTANTLIRCPHPQSGDWPLPSFSTRPHPHTGTYSLCKASMDWARASSRI